MQLFEGNLIQIVPGTDWLISPMNGLVMVFFFLVLGVALQKSRKSPNFPSYKTLLHGTIG
jgi:hypothetical protein